MSNSQAICGFCGFCKRHCECDHFPDVDFCQECELEQAELEQIDKEVNPEDYE